MKKLFFTLLLVLSFTANAQFTLESDDLNGQYGNTFMFDAMGCTGDNFSPELHWKNAPEDTKSFVIILFDQDAPVPLQKGWYHWVVAQIPAEVTKLERGAGNPDKGAAMPEGAIQTLTDFGAHEYKGGCPQSGIHSYTFKIFALKTDFKTSALGEVHKDMTPGAISFLASLDALDVATLTVGCKSTIKQ